jgi:hypothetical protein
VLLKVAKTIHDLRKGEMTPTPKGMQVETCYVGAADAGRGGWGVRMGEERERR